MVTWVNLESHPSRDAALIERRVAFVRVSPTEIAVSPDEADQVRQILADINDAVANAEQYVLRGTDVTSTDVHESAAPADGGGAASVAPPPPPTPEGRVTRFVWHPRYWRANQEPWRIAMTQIAERKGIQLEAIAGGTSPVGICRLEPNAYGIVVYGADGATSRSGDLLPEAIKLAGRPPYKSIPDQRVRVDHNPAFGGLIRDESGHVVAQVVGRICWILFRIHASQSKATFTFLRDLFELAWPMMQNASLQVPPVEVFDVEAAARQYATFRRRSAQDERSRLERELRDVESRLRNLGTEIVSEERRRVALGAQVVALEALTEANGNAARGEFDQILKVPLVTKASVENGRLTVLTDPVSHGNTLFGTFSISIAVGGEVTIRNLTNAKDNHGERIDHPHVTDGKPCWGNIQHGINQMVGRGQYPEAIQVIVSFLGSCNERDLWGRRISLWRESA